MFKERQLYSLLLIKKKKRETDMKRASFAFLGQI